MPIISISVLSGPGIFTSGSWGFGVVRLLGAGDVHLELAKIAPTPEKNMQAIDIFLKGSKNQFRNYDSEFSQIF